MTDKDKELYQNLRFYGEMRFKQLTIFLVWLTIAGTGVSQHVRNDILNGATLQLIIAFASMLVTGIIWIMEVSSTVHWIAHKEALTNGWPNPNIKLKQLNATNSVALLYLISYIFWFYASCEWGGHPYFLVAYGVIFFLILFYTIQNYMPLWRH